jgi:membrane protein DedA with SNARE-associated domain
VSAALAASSDPDDLTGLAGWVADGIDTLGPTGVGLMVALENIVPPIPSEIVLPLAGFLAGQGRMGLVAVIVAATVGSLVGAVVLYEIARAIGRDRLGRWLLRARLATPKDLAATERWFARWGDAAVLLGRCIPVVRSLISFPAGAQRMPRVRFVALTLVGSGAWNAAWVLAGYALGTRWSGASGAAGAAANVVAGILIVLVVVQVVRVVRTLRPGA